MNRDKDKIIVGDEYAISLGDRRPSKTSAGAVRAKVLDLKYPTGHSRWGKGGRRPEYGVLVAIMDSGEQKTLRDAGFVLAPWAEYEERQKHAQAEAHARQLAAVKETGALLELAEKLEAAGLTDPDDFKVFNAYYRHVTVTPSGAKKLAALIETPFGAQAVSA